MNESKLSLTAHYAEIVSAFAVVVSLVFVGLEVRQSNSLARSEAVAALNEATNQANWLIAENIDLADRLARFSEASEHGSLTQAERTSIQFFHQGMMNTWEAAWTAYDQGVIDLATVKPYMADACAVLSRPVLRASNVWENAKNAFNPGFVKFLEGNCVSLGS